MKIFHFHLMSWPNLPADYDGPAWVWCPNSLYDPVEGHRLYNEYLGLLEDSEPLGFDGVCVNEHHQNAYGNMPSPNLMGAVLARTTKKVKIAVIGNALPLYNPPIRVAEEYAMIDVLSGGRLIAGLVVGGGPEYYSYGINPTQARERFSEAHDLILRAWTEPGPFSFQGKYTQLRYVNIWPRPLQQPHPPVWIPGAGSLETIEWVSKMRYAYMGIPYFHVDVFRRTMDLFRAACERNGYTADPEQMGFPLGIYVSDTDENARKEFEPHVWYFIKKLLKGLNLNPPGYTSPQSLMRMFQALPQFMSHQTTWEQLMEGRYLIAGSPQTVLERLSETIEATMCGNMLFGFQIGSLPVDLARRSMERFSADVLPAIRQQFGEKLAARSEDVARPARTPRQEVA
jgi:alkanesulfonate monooxygenase SsuD/methylene tetrahydromethanopterin reductase-like flavin-dependent oxidoreductase (luciferase family)